ncbi:LysE family translocator [Xenophilus azovorans]|uniref:LysE family translocator n=1 Tax=Xenophilus azovorans TaxID=151755 RepID=UPI0005711FBE|nr:LysE family translocator [Xenophilus azovorans]
MPAIETLIPFLGISLLLALTPGPDNVFVLLQSAMHGARAGAVIVLGLCTGLLVHTTVVAVGLGAVLAASTLAFTILKIAGALYLAYLAWKAFRAPVGSQVGSASEREPARRAYVRGVLMNLMNPKVVIFFLAFLPQFVVARSGTSPAVQLLVLGLAFTAATFVSFTAIAWFSGAFGTNFMRSPRLQRALNWSAGLVFLALAIKLAISQQ